LLVVQLDKTKYKEFHNDLLLCDFTKLLEWAKLEENISAVERFLNQKTLTITESWGFSLSISGVQFLKGIDKKEHKVIEQTDIRGNKRLAYRFLRGYDAQIGGKFKWTVDFKAEMSKFSANPTTCDFDDVGFNITRTSERKFDKNNLRDVFDDALIWQVLSLNQLKAAIAEIEKDGNLGKDGKSVTQITIKNSALRKLLSFVPTEANDERMASALALAMPFTDKELVRDDNLTAREIVYKTLWEIYFNDPDSEINNYVATAASILRKLIKNGDSGISEEDLRDLLDYEKGELNSETPVFMAHRNSFAGIIFEYHGTSNNALINDFRLRFIEGLKDFADLTNNCRPHKGFESAYRKVRPFFSQSFYVRAVGAYLIRLAVKNNLLSEINRTCTVEYENKTYTFGKAG
jgi:hypothetical protein